MTAHGRCAMYETGMIRRGYTLAARRSNWRGAIICGNPCQVWLLCVALGNR